MNPQRHILMADFETTVYENQQSTEVWAAAIVELYTEDVKIFHSINEWFDYVTTIEGNPIIYFHNLKFDGEFILSFLMHNGFTQAFQKGKLGLADGDFIQKRFMRSHTFRYSISNRGQWYSITIKVGKKVIEIRDSLKLLPLSVRKIGQSFGTKHHKLDMEYVGYRYAGCEITDEEQKYIANDVLVVKEALEIMFSEGHTKTTIGSCCLAEYKRINYFDNKEQWLKKFPNLYEIEMPKYFQYPSIGDYIRSSYRGGWCYLVTGKENHLYSQGTTADVNSLYPSMMHSESGNRYPIGEPQFWIGNYIPDIAKDKHHYFFIRIKTEFNLKHGKLPCIQIKNDLCYDSTKWLTTSDIYDRKTGEYKNMRLDASNGIIRPTYVILTLTQTDFYLIQEHYNLYNSEILDGCYFEAVTGIFDEYINKYREIKMNSKGAKREVAKLFLNNLYGKMASNTDSSFKYAEMQEDGSIHYIDVIQHDKEPGYIPIGSAITSYARNFTIRAAQANYHGVNKPGFIYADTDSIHCNLPPEQLVGIKVHDSAFCCWKLEAQWDRGLFVRQKTYLERVIAENLIPIDSPYINLKCAGMPEKCKQLFLLSIEEDMQDKLKDGDFRNEILEEYGELGLEFLEGNQNTLSDFKVGLIIPTGKLLPKHINGGIVLVDSPYKVREKLLT